MVITLNELIVFWLLPSLIMFLIACTLDRKISNPIKSWSTDDWCGNVLWSILYPIGLIFTIDFFIREINIRDILFKERKLNTALVVRYSVIIVLLLLVYFVIVYV